MSPWPNRWWGILSGVVVGLGAMMMIFGEYPGPRAFALIVLVAGLYMWVREPL